MSNHSISDSKAFPKLSNDFWKLWIGQTIPSLGGSFTIFALPLLIFMLTNSAQSIFPSQALLVSSPIYYLALLLVPGLTV